MYFFYILLFLGLFLVSPGWVFAQCLPSDINKNGTVDIFDYNSIVRDFGKPSSCTGLESPSPSPSQSTGQLLPGIFTQVGIGTTSPQAKLEVSGDTGSLVDIVSSGGNPTDPVFRVFKDTDKTNPNNIALELRRNGDFYLGFRHPTATDFPDFKWDAAKKTFTVASVLLGDVGDIPDLGFNRANSNGTFVGANENMGEIYWQPCGISQVGIHQCSLTAQGDSSRDSGKIAKIWAKTAGNQQDNSRPGQIHFATTGENRTSPEDRMVIFEDGSVGIGVGNPSLGYTPLRNRSALLEVAGNVIASNFPATSDIRYKKNINPIPGALERVLKLQGVEFEYNIEQFSSMNFSKGKHIGVIAQEIEKTVPEVVSTDSNGFKSVDYQKLSSILVEAIKEQQQRIEKLEKKVEDACAKNGSC